MAFIDSGKTFDKNGHEVSMKAIMKNIDSNSYLFRIPKDLHKKVKRKLIEDEKNLREILIGMLEEYIKK